MPGKFILTLTESDGSLREHKLALGSYVIGRDSGCDIVVSSSDVSRRHAKLTLHQTDLLIEDLGTSTGTRVQNFPVSAKPQRWPYPQSLSMGSVSLDVRPLDEAASVVPLTALGANPDSPLPFEFSKEIARGGMGSIIEADDRKLGRKIAVKVMLLDTDADDAQKQRFVQEAAVLGRLAHPNIVPVYDLGRDSQGQLYYTMKLVKGRTLQGIINGLRCDEAETVNQYTLAHLLTIFRKVCDALAFSHSKGIIHRDLKPENIMVGEFGEVLVMDWGLAKVLGSGEADAPVSSAERGQECPPHNNLGSTLDGSVMGTPQYMSPEQAEGRITDMDGRSDIFSLGGILYCILTLRPPVEGQTVDEVLQKVASGSIASLGNLGKVRRLGSTDGKSAGGASGLERIIPPALAAVTMKALSVSREKRYQDVPALSKDIEAYQNGFATSAENAGAWKQFTLLIKRNKAASIGIAAVLIILTAFVTNVIVSRQRMAATLSQLRGTAPTFQAQAQALLEEGKPDEALDKIAYAISLQPENPDYRGFRANLLQSGQHLSEAVEEYRRVLALRHDDKAAKENLALCEHLEKENGDAVTLNSKLMGEFVDALLKQGRKIEAAPMERTIGKGQSAVEAALLARLKEYTSQKGWNRNKLVRMPDGAFSVDLSALQIGDLGKLSDFPVGRLVLIHASLVRVPVLQGYTRLTQLNMGRNNIYDLTPLRGLALQELEINATKVSTITPLADMPLEKLDISQTQVRDLSALQGMPLKWLNIAYLGIKDLSCLKGFPLQELRISGNPVVNLSPLRLLPLRVLALDKCYNVADFTPLAGMTHIEELKLPKQIQDISFLKRLPHLERVFVEDQTPDLMPIADYWKLPARSAASQP